MQSLPNVFNEWEYIGTLIFNGELQENDELVKNAPTDNRTYRFTIPGEGILEVIKPKNSKYYCDPKDYGVFLIKEYKDRDYSYHGTNTNGTKYIAERATTHLEILTFKNKLTTGH